MNLHVDLTKTQREALERSRRFRASIAAKAEELKIKKTVGMAVRISAVEAPLTVIPQIKQVNSDLIATEIVPPESINWFAILATADQPKYPSIREIQLAVCKEFDLNLMDLLSPRRGAQLVRARQIACYLSKKMTPRSLPEIGRRTGNRDHTTVLYSVRKIELMRSRDRIFDAEISSLIAKIGAAYDNTNSHRLCQAEANPAASPDCASPISDQGREASKHSPG